MRPDLDGSIIFYYFIVVVIFLGGVIMLLLTGGILSIQNEDPLNLFLNESTELAIFSITGVALISSPFWLVPYIRRTIRRKQEIKLGVSHHSRNRAQTILMALELLESTTGPSEEQLTLIRTAKSSCLAMIDSLSKVVESDGENIDYSLTMKEYPK